MPRPRVHQLEIQLTKDTVRVYDSTCKVEAHADNPFGGEWKELFLYVGASQDQPGKWSAFKMLEIETGAVGAAEIQLFGDAKNLPGQS